MSDEKEVLEPCSKCVKSDPHLIYRIRSLDDHTFGYQGECASCGNTSEWKVVRSLAKRYWNKEQGNRPS